MATPTRRQALVAALLSDGWRELPEKRTHSHRVMEDSNLPVENHRRERRIWIGKNGKMRRGPVKTRTVVQHIHSDYRKLEDSESMVERGRGMLG